MLPSSRRRSEPRAKLTNCYPATLGTMTVFRSPITVWVAFVLAHLWLGMLNLYAPGLPLGDVTIVYRFWVDQASRRLLGRHRQRLGVPDRRARADARSPMAFGPDLYASTWLTMVMLLNAVAFGFVTGWGRSRERVARGLVVGRVPRAARPDRARPHRLRDRAARDRRRAAPRAPPGVAALLLTIATWIKVWPAALIAAAVIALRDRLRIVARRARRSESMVSRVS